MSFNTQDAAMEPIVDGMISLIRKNLIAYTKLVADAHIGDTEIFVENTLRFNNFDNVVVMDNNSNYNSDSQEYSGLQFCQIVEQPNTINRIKLKEPLAQNYLVANNGRIQKSIKNALLYDKDVLYGDRAVIPFDHVAVCVEPESKAQDWIALHGLLNVEYRLSIIVYVKSGGTGDEEEYAMRIVSAYADAINNLLINNIHVDVAVDEVPLLRDACCGKKSVIIGSDVAQNWLPDPCCVYEVQDNFQAQQEFAIIDRYPSSSSTSSCISCDISTSSGSSSSSLMSSASSLSSDRSSSSSLSSLSSRSSASTSSSSSESSISATSLSSQSLSSMTTQSYSSSSSTTSAGGNLYEVFLDRPLWANFKVVNKAVLRRQKRFFYDSRVENTEYGTVQKGSAILKAARLSWFGKETEQHLFPQVGKG